MNVAVGQRANLRTTSTMDVTMASAASCMVELATRNAAQGAVTKDEAIKVEGETHVIPSFKI